MNILKGLTKIKSSFARFIETTNNFMWVHRNEKFADRRLVIEQLTDRELVRVHGEEVVPFLQGLITNDMAHLQSDSTPLAKTPAMYTMFLNKAGRVLYDSIIYRTPEPNTYLIECDKYISNELRRHLRLYRVRRNIQIDAVGGEYRPWIVFNPVGSVVRMDTSVQVGQEVISTPDPRVRDLGTRVITKSDKTWKDLANMFSKTGDVTVAKPTNDCNYRMHRYRYGVGEGVQDLPPGKSFPLEANCDYLHGVSFHKGCYIGQELTARVHHTGVVRKRIMPLRLSGPAPQTSLTISTEAGANVGVIRSADFDRALGLVRVEQALNSPKLFVDGKICYVEKPYWWPSELPKKTRVEGTGMDEVKCSTETADNYINNYDDLQLNVKDEEAEIARLEIPVPNITGTEKCEFQNDDRTPKIEFQCTECDMLEMVHYYGKIPPFVYGLQLLEDSFVMRDPFQPPPVRWKPKAEYFVILGAKCSVCENVVCRSTECSFYYTHTYCLSCAEINRSKFPQEAQAKLRKQLVQKIK